MDNKQMIGAAISMLKGIDPKTIEVINFDRTAYDDGSVGFSVNITTPAKKEDPVYVDIGSPTGKIVAAEEPGQQDGLYFKGPFHATYTESTENEKDKPRLCCENAYEKGCIDWNPFNKVVQCHSCGHTYVMEENKKV